jgi:glucose/mannose-6-phosphate isomerase
MNDLLHEQLAFVPEVHGPAKVTASTLVCSGMGGSGQVGTMLRFLGVPQNVTVHHDYGLPTNISPDAACIAISYSGNTEETLSFAQEALEKGLPLSVVTSGGRLLELAKEHSLPHVQVPGGFQPRDMIVAMTKALLALIGANDLLAELSHGVAFIDDFEGQTQKQATLLSGILANATPIFYSSARNEHLAYIAKIQCNETAKIPAFLNVFPELNHNEMQGYDTSATSHVLTQQFVVVFLRDDSDSEHIQRRRELTEQVLRDKGVRTTSVTLRGDTRVQTFLFTWWLMRDVARTLASVYGVSPDETPIADTFKRSL